MHTQEMIILIAAVAKNNVIEKEGRIPWNIPEERTDYHHVEQEKFWLFSYSVSAHCRACSCHSGPKGYAGRSAKATVGKASSR